MAVIENNINNTVVSGTSGNDTIDNHESNLVTIKAGGGNDSIYNGGNNVIVFCGSGNDTMRLWGGTNVTVSGGSDDDTIYNELGNYISISGDEGNDSIRSDQGTNLTLNGGAGDDHVDTFGQKNLLIGGTGNDQFYAGYCYSYSDYSILEWSSGDDCTIVGGAGNDTIWLRNDGDSRNTLIKYASGDGNDFIDGFNADDTLQIGGGKGTYSSETSGSNVIVTVGKGKITLVGAASLSKLNISGTQKTAKEKNSWKLKGTIATYGTTSKTLATVKGAKSVSGLSTSDKKITLKNSALSKKVTVKGSYEFDFASNYKNATISGTANADTITARGSKLKIVGGAGKDSIKMVGTNQTISGGAGADVFIYAASGGNEKITDFQSIDKLKIGEDGDGNYSTVTSGDNLIVSTDDGGKITLVGAANLSNVDIVGTKKTSGKGVKVSGNGKKITLTENFEDNSFSLSGKYSSAVTVDASEVLLDLNITGNNFSNRIIGTAQDDTIDGGAGADTIYGGDGNDSIFGGKGNDIIFGGIGKDTLWGGAGDDELYGDDGKDVFYCNAGEGNDTIFGYEASVDKIILAGGTISNVTTDRNNNVIFSVGDGQIVVNNGADRTVKIVNSSGKIVDNGLYEP